MMGPYGKGKDKKSVRGNLSKYEFYLDKAYAFLWMLF